MHRTTVIGLLVGSALVATSGIALAATRQASPPTSRRPYFEYRVKEGDTLSALGLRFFGDARAWPALLEGQPKPFTMLETLPAGAILHVPCAWHVVRPGDTLAKIAKETLLDSGRWRRIFEANRDALRDPDRLEIGRTLAVPSLPAVLLQQLAAAHTDVGGSDCSGLDILGAL